MSGGFVTKRFEGMLLLGAAGRNAGKTELACRAISMAVRSGIPVIGIKVTTIHECGGACPRGGEGCGACNLPDSDFIITREESGGSGKDTARMLSAGATEVFWLRSKAGCLFAAVEELKKMIPDGAITVCESNSVRTVLEPDIFLVVKDRFSESVKPGCRAVAGLADGTVVSDGKSFSIDESRLSIAGGRWVLKRKATALILAGGKSARMGTNKALLSIGGRPMLAHIAEQLAPMFEEVMVSAAKASDYPFFGGRIVEDEKPGRGPLEGLSDAMGQAGHETVFVMPCDIPDVPLHQVSRLMRAAGNADGAVPELPDGRIEPLFAVYKKRMAEFARAALARGERRVIAMYAGSNIARVPVSEGTILHNLNTMAEYADHVSRTSPARSVRPAGSAGSCEEKAAG